MESNEMTKNRNHAVYASFLTLETAAATYLFFEVFPYFAEMIARPGQPQELTTIVGIEVGLGALALISAYFFRYHRVAVHVPFQSALLGHLVQFAGRMSFIFGGALFSILFFQHLPELDRMIVIEQVLLRGVAVLWVLFALFCYSLELDRLGRAIEDGNVAGK